MIDRDALAQELYAIFYSGPELNVSRWGSVADIAMRHITAARAEAFKEAAKIVWDAVPATCTNQWHVELIEICHELEAKATEQSTNV